MSAVLRKPSEVIPRTLYLMILAFSLKKTKCKNKLGKTQNFKILIAGEVLECLLGASGCSFFGS